MSESVSEATESAEPPALASRSIVTGGVHATMFALALPALLEQLLTFFVGFYDTWLSGEISAVATDAVGLATYVDWLGGMMFRLVGIGAAALVARQWGAGELEEANRTTNRALALASVMGLAVSVLMYVAAPLFTLLLGLRGKQNRLRSITCASIRFVTSSSVLRSSEGRSSGRRATPARPC